MDRLEDKGLDQQTSGQNACEKSKVSVPGLANLGNVDLIRASNSTWSIKLPIVLQFRSTLRKDVLVIDVLEPFALSLL